VQISFNYQFQRCVVKLLKVFVALLLTFNFCLLNAWSHTAALKAGEGDTFAGINLPVYEWSNGNPAPDAIVLGLHGGCLHGRAFDHLAQKLANKDLLFVSLDMRGYGAWYHERFGERKDRTFNYKQTRRDIAVVIKRLQEKFPGTPIFALGESVGANMAIVIAADEPDLLNGMVLVSPSSAIRFFMSPEMLIRGVQGIGVPFGKVNIKGILRNRLANKEEISLEHLNDPLGRDYQSLLELSRSWRLNLKAMRDAYKVPAEMPVLVFIGSQDQLCNTKMTVLMFDQLKAIDKQLLVLPDSGHLMVETAFASPETIEHISAWIRHRSRSKTASSSSILVEVSPAADSP
jgi:alpha-beta hydrolase superfamily lysophospholipase